MPKVADPDVKATAVHTPVPVPLHGAEKVKRDLERDVALGIIEPVPLKTATNWCSRIIIVPKATGSPIELLILRLSTMHLRGRLTTPSPHSCC